MGPEWAQDGATMVQDGAEVGQDGTKMEPRWAKMEPRRAKIGQDGPTEVTKTVQDGAKMGQDAAKTRENESNKCGHSRQIRCFRKGGTIQRQRRANNVRMKQILDRGRTDRREKEAKCGHGRGPKVCGWLEVMQDGSKMDPKVIQQLVKIRLPGPKGSPCECIEVMT